MKRQPREDTIGLTVRIQRDTHQAARVEAAKRGMSVNALVNQLLSEAANKPRPRKQPA